MTLQHSIFMCKKKSRHFSIQKTEKLFESRHGSSRGLIFLFMLFWWSSQPQVLPWWWAFLVYELASTSPGWAVTSSFFSFHYCSAEFTRCCGDGHFCSHTVVLQRPQKFKEVLQEVGVLPTRDLICFEKPDRPEKNEKNAWKTGSWS